MLRLRGLHRLLLGLESTALLLLTLLLISLPLLQILGRWLEWQGLAWADQAVRLCVLWLAMTGAMIATRQLKHIRIDLLSVLPSPALRDAVERFSYAVAAATCGFVSWHCAMLAKADYLDGARTFLQLPLWLSEIIIPVAFAVMALRFVAAVLRCREAAP